MPFVSRFSGFFAQHANEVLAKSQSTLPARKWPDNVASALQRFINLQLTVSLEPVAPRTRIATQLAAHRGLVASEQAGDLRDVVLGIHKAGNPVSFNSADVFAVHRATLTCRSGSLGY